MHPLPPPRGTDTSRDQQSTETRTSVPSMADPSPSQGQDQSSLSVPQLSTDGRKKRKHRGGKKKRNRRQSFAAPSEDSALPTLEEGPGEDPSAEMPSNTLSARKPFYRRGQSSGNLSSTSLDSDVLLDHRYVLYKRAVSTYINTRL